MPVFVTMPLSASRRHKVRPASMIHPNSMLVGSPRIALLASRPAPLLHQLHSAPRIRLAVISPAIIGSTVKRLRRATRTFWMLRSFVRLRHKLRPATMVHPDSAPIETPRHTFVARCFAVLPDQVHISARVRLTIMPRTVFRRAAHNRLAPSILARTFKLHSEIRTASVIHPDSAFVISPRVSLLATRPAGLFFQRDSRPRIRRAVSPPSVIRRAGNLSPATRIALPHRHLGKGAYQCAQHNHHPQNSHSDLRIRQKPGTAVYATVPGVPANLNPFLDRSARKCTRPIHALFNVPAKESSVPSVSYNFSRQNSWLTESFCARLHR